VKLWLVKPGAVNFAKRYLFTYLSAHIAYFVVWVLWTVMIHPSRPASFSEMGSWHLISPMLFVALWYSYLQRSWRVRSLYLSG
jgi:isoprenylcysteine carboxyl methyltransferase (ICMT) family protein YpbQ